jgi:hypothetical protein
MVRTVIEANDIAPAAQEQRKKIAVHFRFKMQVVKYNSSGAAP